MLANLNTIETISKEQVKQVEEYLKSHSVNSEFLWIAKPFYNHFADWKNTLASLCDGDFIFQIDADEYPNEQLIALLPEVLESNPEVDLYWIPRINTGQEKYTLLPT